MSSEYKQISGGEELSHLLTTLKECFPISKPMWQVVKDTRDGSMDANLFTDNWPDYTTVVSQEFAPRLSQRADIRIHSKIKKVDRVMQVINGAELLPSNVEWQLILYASGDEKEDADFTRDLTNALSGHPAVKDTNTVTSYSWPLLDFVKEPLELMKVPSGYIMKGLLPEHAELVADKEGWNAKRTHLQPWFMDVTSYEQRLGYFRESIKRFGAVGMFTDDPSRPVSWVIKKPGGIQGVAYTHKDHRGIKLHLSATTFLATMAYFNGEVVLGETWTTSPRVLQRLCGLSNGIVLQRPKAMANL